MMDLMDQDQTTQQLQAPTTQVPPPSPQPPSTPLGIPPITPQPPAEEKKFNQVKALGWILALITAIFIFLVVSRFFLNFSGLGGAKGEISIPTPTISPEFNPTTTLTPLPTQIPESRFKTSP